jgi:hypothetical protein
MTSDQDDPIGALLVRDLPKDLVLGVEEALNVGARRALGAAGPMDEGHLSSIVGQLRHFHSNEAFHRALDAAGAAPTELAGNRVVTGRSGIFRLSRFSIARGVWLSSKRSKTRAQMALANHAIEQLVQPQLFGEPPPVTEAVAFFVSVFSGSLAECPDRPVAIELAVPSRDMMYWIFREPVQRFIDRYERRSQQEDLAKPVLRPQVQKKAGNEGAA